MNRTALLLVLFVVFMFGFAYASVPLYRVFCQVTGFGGTPKTNVEFVEHQVGDRIVKVQFDANVNRDMPWDFKAVQSDMEVRTGENHLIFYHAKNETDAPIKGVATFNVTPDKAATYFSKISCFCFEEQTLAAHQQVDMPVSFFIDPEFEHDKEMDDVHVITLSYTFFNADS